LFVHVDAKQLEWIGAIYLSQDPVGLQEILDAVDMHSANQERFKLPSRLIAKTFLFRLIYGGTEWAYAYDSNFNHVSDNPKFWRRVIEDAYTKYATLAKTHTNWEQTVVRTGKLVMPTGREYAFSPYRDKRTNELKWPRTTILNYPVQGLGNDLMAIVRTLLYARLCSRSDLNSVLCCTVHDSIDVDCPADEVDEVIKLVQSAFDDAPARFKQLFGVDFNLPLRCEIFTGNNLKALTAAN
jgi:DNA polymerase I-like protein with 3'-5' exonuclease and polymerase domains